MIKFNRSNLLLAITVSEAIIIILLVICRYHGVHLVIRSEPVVSSPLELALEYQSPDKKFEELVKKYPGWTKYQVLLPDGTKGMPVLASCAMLSLTNHVRILVANGADMGQAIDSLKKVGANDAIKIIQDVAADLRDKAGSAYGADVLHYSEDSFQSHQ